MRGSLCPWLQLAAPGRTTEFTAQSRGMEPATISALYVWVKMKTVPSGRHRGRFTAEKQSNGCCKAERRTSHVQAWLTLAHSLFTPTGHCEPPKAESRGPRSEAQASDRPSLRMARPEFDLKVSRTGLCPGQTTPGVKKPWMAKQWLWCVCGSHFFFFSIFPIFCNVNIIFVLLS